jgi:hypothetical protein
MLLWQQEGEEFDGIKEGNFRWFGDDWLGRGGLVGVSRSIASGTTEVDEVRDHEGRR